MSGCGDDYSGTGSPPPRPSVHLSCDDVEGSIEREKWFGWLVDYVMTAPAGAQTVIVSPRLQAEVMAEVERRRGEG